MAFPIVNGVYYLQNAGTGAVLTLANGSSEDNTPIQASQKLALNDFKVLNQLWLVVQVDLENPTYTLLNTAGGTYADISGGATNNATPLVGLKETDSARQRWSITPSNNKISYVLKNQYSGTYMDLKGGWTADGTPVQIWDGNGASTTNQNQLWNLIHV